MEKKTKSKKKEKGQKVVLKKANILKRFLAFIADLIIAKLTVLLFFDLWMNSLLKGINSFEGKQTYISQNIDFFTIFFTFYFLIIILYFSSFEYILGKTPGKAFFNITVISLDGKQEYWKFLIRSLQLFLIVPLWILDLIPILFKRERLLEMITKTAVIESNFVSVKKK